MKRIPLVLLCLFFLMVGFGLRGGLEDGQVMAALRDFGPMLAAAMLAVLALLLLGVWIGYGLVQRYVRRLLGRDANMSDTEMVTGLVDHFTTPPGVENPTPEDRRHAAMVNLGLWMARRTAVQFSFGATVTVIGGLLGTATLFLLYEQNQKFDLQNERITLQTDANITESVLLEGARRAALSADMANLFADIRTAADTGKASCADDDTEERPRDCWLRGVSGEDTGEDFTPTPVFLPSDALHARMASFARRNTPYRLAISTSSALDFDVPLRDQFIIQNTSPERGQLLETLARNSVAMTSLELGGAQLTGVFLNGAQLQGAQLTEADLRGAILRDGTKLSFANLRGALLSNSGFQNVLLRETDLTNADLRNTTFVFSDLNSAMLTGANLDTADLYHSQLAYADFDGAILRNAAIRFSNITGASFVGADLTGAEFIDVWAWDTDPPQGLPDSIAVVLCPVTDNMDTQVQKPSDCRN